MNFNTGWYVLYVKSRHEKKVHDLLVEHSIDSFLPLYKSVRKWSDRKKIIHKPLFPSYIFVNNRNSKDFYRALSVDGACDYIRFGNKYALLKEDELSRIKLLFDYEDFCNIEVTNEAFGVGEIRKISCGPLCGLECEILRLDGNDKVLIRIESLRQNITASLPGYCIGDNVLVSN